MSFQYDHIFSELMPHVVRANAAIVRAVETLEPSLVLVGGHGFNSHAAACAARARGVRSVLVQHGGALTLLHGTSADMVWAWGGLPARIIRESYGWPAARVAPVGAPQVAHVRQRANDPGRRAEIRERFGVPADGRMLLVITSGCTDGPWQPAVTSRLIESWDGMLDWTVRNPGVTVVLRPHPLMDMSAWYRMVAARASVRNLSIASEGSLDDIIHGADAAAVMETTTTAALVAHAAGCPVLHIRSARWSVEGDAVWTESDGLTVAQRPADIAPMLDGILKDGALRDECVRRGRLFFDAYVADDAGLTERVRVAAAAAMPASTARQLR